MRSIKEKSFELFPEMQTDSDDWDVIEEQCDRDDQRKAFTKGAEYVLDAIEKECKRIAQLCKNHVENPVDEEDRVDSWARLDEMEYMLKFIEQLKK